MNKSKLRGWVLVLTVGVGFLLAPAARGVELDDALLIDRLARDGMNELLEHLAKVGVQRDPVIQKLIEVARQRVRMGDRELEQDQRRAAFKAMLSNSEALIREHYDDARRPMWQTDLAEAVFFGYLPNVERLGAEFYEFGVPTAQQRQGFEKTASEVFEQLSDADLRFFQLQAQLPLEPDHEEKRVVTGLWDRMMREYYKTKTQFYLGMSAYYTALLGDDHPYYKTLGSNSKVPRQRKEARQERARLLDLAIEKLEPFAGRGGDEFGIKLLSMCLMGRAVLHQGTDPGRALELFDKVISADQKDLNMLSAQLATGVAWDQKNQTAVGLEKLDALNAKPMIQENLFFRLLVVDQMHRILMDRAKAAPESQRQEAINQSYQPYERLMADPSLGERVEAYKQYIYGRWRESVEGDDGGVPDVVVRAVAEINRIEGQNLMVRSDELSKQGQDVQAEELVQQALPKLKQAVDVATKLLKREKLSRQTKAEAMFNLATAQYFLAQGDLAGQLLACDTWTALADENPDQPTAEQAITFAITVLQQLYDYSPRPEGAGEAYQKAAKVLFEKFPTAPIADDERLYYGFNVLVGGGRYEQAVEILGKVPHGHPTYFEAQREMMLSLKALHDQAEKPADRNVLEQRLEQAAQGLVREADQAGRDDPSAKNAKGWAKLMLIDLATNRNETESAIRQLDEFDREFTDQPDLISESLARGIMVLTRAGKFEEAVARAQEMMKLFADSGAVVINGVLEGLDRQVDQLRRQAQQELVAAEKARLMEEALRMARTAEPLAQMLVRWANEQGYDGEQMLPFELILAKAMRLSGKPDGAIELLKPLAVEFPQDPEVLHHLGESYFAIGEKEGPTAKGRTALIEAATKYFDPLIVGLESQDDPRLKSLWWNAWTRRLQVSDILNEGTEDIALRVRQLEKSTDENLGGEPYRSKLKELERKHIR